MTTYRDYMNGLLRPYGFVLDESLKVTDADNKLNIEFKFECDESMKDSRELVMPILFERVQQELANTGMRIVSGPYAHWDGYTATIRATAKQEVA